MVIFYIKDPDQPYRSDQDKPTYTLLPMMYNHSSVVTIHPDNETLMLTTIGKHVDLIEIKIEDMLD